MHHNEPSIRILPHGRQIKTSSGQTVLEALIHQSIFLRSDCGGKGTCGKCMVERKRDDGSYETIKACNHVVADEISIKIPESSMLSSHIMSKAPVVFPPAFGERLRQQGGEDAYGIAVDLGTTTIAVYLCNILKGEIISTLAIKNPQAIYGDDVMSRIGVIGQNPENLGRLQKLVVKSIEWGMQELLRAFGNVGTTITRMVAVGNPTMIHILAGVDPQSIGVSPYRPAFYHAATFRSGVLGFAMADFPLLTLPQVSGFIGGDLLAAALAVDLTGQTEGTLLVDLGTNGELILKGKDQFYATSCATGPAFEGASLSCGMQAIPGAINAVQIADDQTLSGFSTIQSSGAKEKNPTGICGAGVINAVAQFCEKQIISPSGVFTTSRKSYILVEENQALGQPAISISQKDIRSVQLGKSALITGIEFLLKKAGLNRPRKILIAGAFGSHLRKTDLIRLGIIPNIALGDIEMVGNAAGSGAVMALCDETYIDQAAQLAAQIAIVDLACNVDFQNMFIDNLNLQHS
ncbi:MAG: ASKHA domain-containing protein [Desulforhopalus sp.]|nr:ASKHA domain-containing protein [Desulforhopalus sp.]